VQNGVIRPRAYLELARLRFKAQPTAVNGEFTPAQVADVLEPLALARRQSPPLPEVYDLIAEVWKKSATPPLPGDLAVVEEGLALFLTEPSSSTEAAVLYADRGDRGRAAKLVANRPEPSRPITWSAARFSVLQAKLTPGTFAERSYSAAVRSGPPSSFPPASKAWRFRLKYFSIDPDSNRLFLPLPPVAPSRVWSPTRDRDSVDNRSRTEAV